MTKQLTMSSLYRKLSALGFNQNYVKSNGLPSWWNDELNHKPLAVLEGAGYIADNFNLDLKSLLTSEEKIRFNTLPNTKFKQYNNNNKEYPNIAQALASRVAELITYGTEINFTPLPTNVKKIRSEILSTNQTVNLTSLLEYCWNQGIIVAHFDNFPNKIKKFAGLIQWQFSRPVIILSSNYKYSAKLAFDLAHELGHLALRHLQEGILVDEKIENNYNNDEENQANQFATHLLLDQADNCLGNQKFKNTKTFVKYVLNNIIPHYKNIESEAVILNYGWHNKEFFPLVYSVLKELHPVTHGQQIINEYLANKLNWDLFNDETYEYLEKVLGV